MSKSGILFAFRKYASLNMHMDIGRNIDESMLVK